MEKRPDKLWARKRSRFRYRVQVAGSEKRPRLAVFRSLKHIYVQAIDDQRSVTLASACTLDKEFRSSGFRGNNVEGARKIGEMIGKKLVEKGFQGATFDRGGFRYRGRVKALGEGARAAGLKI